MKVVPIEPPSFTEKVSQKTNRPYKLWTFKVVDGTEFRNIYLGSVTPAVGQELDLTQDDKGGWKLVDAPQGAPRGSTKSYGKSPEEIASIQWQTALKAAVEAVRDYHTVVTNPVKDLADYKKMIVETATTFAAVILNQPKTIEHNEPPKLVKPPALQKSTDVVPDDIVSDEEVNEAMANAPYPHGTA